jgi:glycosyltransferase involved in cell wall biosynthesis
VLLVEQGGRGGEADYTRELAGALASEGWRVDLATAEDHCYPRSGTVSVHAVFHYVRGESGLARAARGAGLGRVTNGVRFLAALPRLMRLSRRADVVHVQGWEFVPLGVLAVLSLRLAGATVVQTWHNTFERREGGGPAPRVAKDPGLARDMLARLAARTIVHTQADLARLPGWMRARTVVIPHGEYGGLARTAAPADRDAARSALGVAHDAPATLLFGQLRTDKGLADLLGAAALVSGLHVIVGGQELGALAAAREQLRSPELAGRVTIREGFLDMSEAAQLFAATDTVALPYHVASQSGVLLLAYGFHRPVVVYPVGGLPEAVLDGETGWICARADADALAAALRDAAARGAAECRRRGEAGAALAETRFAWPVIAQRTGEVYEQALRRTAA